MLLRPLPGAREPAQLVATQGPVAFAYFESYRGLSDVATATAAYNGPAPFNLALENGDAAHTERVSGHLVSLEYFSTLGARPLLGRFFDPDLERRGGPPTAVVSERFWRTRLNADSHVIGRAVWINRQLATIVGVAEKDFQGLFPIMPADIFVPVTADPAVAPELAGNALENPASRVFRIVLRLAPGVNIRPLRPLSTPGRDSSTTPTAIVRRIKKASRAERASSEPTTWRRIRSSSVR